MKSDNHRRQSFSLTGALNSLILFVLIGGLLSGCAGFAKGVTEALLEDDGGEVDKRKCYVRGRAFPGLESLMKLQEEQPTSGTEDHRSMKVLMVHGIGSHAPGYATRLGENLAKALNLPQVVEKTKIFQLAHPQHPGELGTLQVSRFLNDDIGRELLFYELTWDPIIEPAKEQIYFDNSGVYSFRRTTLNNTLKLFVNDTVPDVILYYGEHRDQIQLSVRQAICWMMSDTWQTLPSEGAVFCDATNPETLDRLGDDYAFITHSLGSRVTNDALRTVAEMVKSDPDVSRRVEGLEERVFPVFMLSNQLPLLQLGQPEPKVKGQIKEMCGPAAPRAHERLFKETRIIAFSDPNDLFSYAIPPNYLDKYVDSRLCPTLTNIILNVAPLNDLFGLGEVANPMSAHTEYDNDERVINLIAHGVGHPATSPIVTERCEWMEAIPSEE